MTETENQEIQKKENPYKIIGEFFLDLLETFIIAIGLFIIIYNFLIQPNSVLGSSMEPNFYDGEYILTDRISYRFQEPERGDVIVFKYPKDPSIDYIKRIIGLPGEKVLIQNNEITIFNDEHPQGFTLNEKYLPEKTVTQGGAIFSENKETVIPYDEYFVLGDNRSRSSDSRVWGTVTVENITGRAIFRYWPFNQFGNIKKIDY